ncbi:MAG: peptidoglycan binding domain-containing protein [Lachnospiraceae bacterium]
MSDKQGKQKTSEEIIEETMKEIRDEMQNEETEFYDEEDDQEILLDKEDAEDVDANNDDDSIYYNDDDFDGESKEELVVDESEEAFEEDEHQSEKKGKGKKIALISLGSIVGLLLTAYLGFSLFFTNHFYFNTEINGVDFSAKGVAAVESYMSKQVEGYQLSIQELNQKTEVIRGSDIDMVYIPGRDVKKALKNQNPFLWFQALYSKDEAKVTIEVDYNKEKLTTVINTLSCMKPENQTESVSATPTFDGNQFVVTPEVVGTKLNNEQFQKAVMDSVGQFRPTVDLQKENCYTLPKFVQDSKEVLAAKDAMNKYMTASITYDFSPAVEVVDKALISGWVGVDANMGVVFNTDAVGAYLQELAGKYNTVGKTRAITTPDGKATQVSGGTYGWKMDYDAELQALIASIQNGEVVSRAPAYAQTAATHAENDWGDTYIEVDLSNQQMWYISGGGVAFQTAVVTGKPDPKHATPEGVFSILEKMRNKVLTGATQADGQPEYKTPVDYWMRVTYTGVGFHDAPWQSSFGGSRYADGYGSHGCINMSPSDAAQLYELIQNGVPVIMHY